MPKRTTRASLAILFSLSLTVPAISDENSGAYLAANAALAEYDYKSASLYYARALVADPSNPEILENAAIAYIGQGALDAAVTIAKRLESQQPDNQIANIVLLADAVNSERFGDAAVLLEKDRSVGPLVEGLSQAWAQTGLGSMAQALKGFDEVAGREGLDSFGRYHKALALALAGDLENAEAIFSGTDGGSALPPTRRALVAHVQILSQLERGSEAVELIRSVPGANRDPILSDLLFRLSAGQPLEFTAIRNIQDGFAEVFFTVAGALRGEANDNFTVLFSRTAQYLRPDHVEAHILTAELLERLGRYDLATGSYDMIAEDHPAYYTAEIGRANALRLSGEFETAAETLQNLSSAYPDRPDAFIELGDILRRQSRYEDSIAPYSQAIALYPEHSENHWLLFFTRGISYERTDQWPKAEADFRKALELNPEQPQVLNYLGYSYVEMRENLDEALAMIQTAVAARPQDGYITDSLGWVYYRLGRFDEAVGPMERAAELLPTDPIVNDHLGDVYWAVGRKLEAEFQWNRALSFDPEEDEIDRIRRKLDVGLDVVLAEEDADGPHDN